jgi:DNA-binding SARP family transcriptional activator
LVFAKELRLLCRKALALDIEVEYARNLISAGYLHDPQPPLDLENWPWPIKIHTLGHFSVLKQDAPLEFAAKAQRKLLDLLKVLIALGGRDVLIDRLVGILWPVEHVGDGHKALEIAVHRLRKLLGTDDVVRVSERRLTLNGQLVWVDALALDSILEQTVPVLASAEPSIEVLEQTAPQVLKLYRGHFLAGDAEAPWHVPLRNRLSGRFQRFVMRLGGHREAAHRWPEASRLYEHAIELDPLAESFYRRLIVCLQQQGRRAEAIEVFRRCRQTLSVLLGVMPTTETEAIHRESLRS